jgi:hypothetical protein
MQLDTSVSRRQLRLGRLITGVASAIILMSATGKIAGIPKIVGGLIHAGIPTAAILPIAVLELGCLALYVWPRTAMLGTFLLTGFLGGAIVTHIIGRESFLPPLLVGILVFAGAWLRLSELRNAAPFPTLSRR